MRLPALVLGAPTLALAGLLAGCGGDGASGGGGGAPTCQPVNVCTCADDGPPDFSHETDGVPAVGATDLQRAALVRANHWRTAAGLPPINGNAMLADAAKAHTLFMAGNPSTCWPGAHFETMGCGGFTGTSPGARVQAAGYHFASVGEVINWEDTPAAAIDGWIWTVYHREPFTDIGYVEAGFDEEVGPLNGRPNAHHNTMDLGRSLGVAVPAQTGVAVFPPAGTTGVPPAFQGNLEGPTPPLPASGRWPSGSVISLDFPSSNFTVASHQIYNSFCEPVPHTYFTTANDPNNHNARFVYFYANQPLNHAETYTVEVHATVDGADWSRTWKFHTQ